MNFFAQKGSMVDSALEYAQAGFPVFPAHFLPSDHGQGRVSPLVAGGRNAATTEPEQILQWWASFPDALIAIPTGAASGLLAVTLPKSAPLDTKTPCFSTFFSENCYLFQFPSSGEKPACGHLDGGSFSGEGGFIVVPPSSLAYKNAENEAISGCYSVLQDGEIQGAPGELLQKIREIATVEKTEIVVPSGMPEIFRGIEKKQEPEPEQEEQEEEEEGLPRLPLECLPPQLRTVVEGAAKSYNIDCWLPFAAALSTAATIVGANVMIENRKQYPGHLWLCLVGRSTIGKSDITNFFYTSIYNQEALFCDLYEKALENYENELEEWEQAKSEALKKKEKFKEKKPELPQKTTLYVDDVTPESLTMVLKNNPGGVSWNCDEIRTLLSSFGRYGGKGSEKAAKARLLSLYGGAPTKLDRKNGQPSSLARQSWLSIFGTVQPAILPKIFDPEDRGSGFLQRFMFIHAKKLPPKIDPSKRPELSSFKKQVTDIFDKMLMDVPRLIPGDKESKPLYVRPDKQGREMINHFIFELEKQSYYLSGEGEAADEAESRAGRWQDQLPRLILLMHCLERAEQGIGIGTVISAQTVEKTIHIFKALMEHSKTAWKLIKNESVKKPKSLDIIDIIDKYVDKTREVFEIKYAERVGTKTKSDLILTEIGAGTTSISTRQALTKALENLGFSKKSCNTGIKMVIEKGKYQAILDKIEAKKATERQTQFVPTPPAPKNDNFFRELTEGMGVESF